MASPRVEPALSVIEDILQTRSIVTCFQPILSARQKAVVGVEALSRARLVGDRLIPPASLFQMARNEGAADELQTLCHRTAIDSFATLAAHAPELLLFLNLAAPVAQPPAAVADALIRSVRAAGLQPGSVAIEILEAEVADKAMLGALIGILRGHGFLIVLDDVGVGHSNLDRVSFIRPDILKIDRSLIAHVDTDYHKQGTLKSLVDLCRKVGALVVAEGIETEPEAITALELGADLLQGFFLATPEPLPAVPDASLSAARAHIEAVARRFKHYMVGKINDRKLEHRRFNVIVNEILCDLTGNDVASFDDILNRTIARYPSVECLYVLDHSGVQVTDTVSNPAMIRREDSFIFRPAPRGTDHSLKEYYYILLDVELHKYTTDPYVSFATGNISRAISTYFRDARTSRMYVLCVDVRCE
jgi:EAL domain-containing protein (putative c-di-GMP-specific phosphodiesterase class I)